MDELAHSIQNEGHWRVSDWLMNVHPRIRIIPGEKFNWLKIMMYIIVQYQWLQR